MLNKASACGITCILVVLTCLNVACGPRPKRGEVKSDRGGIYYFKDGFIAVDTSRSPHEYYVWEADPNKVRSVTIGDDGLEISSAGRQQTESFGFKITSMGIPRPEPGHVVQFLEDAGGQIGGRNVVADAGPIQDLIDKKDWSVSVREVLKK